MHKDCLLQVRLKHQPNKPYEWRLGKGPCGKEVVALKMIRAQDGVMVYQYCEDQGEPDVFLYPWHVVLEVREYPEGKGEACRL